MLYFAAMTLQPSAKAAERGEPSYVWRAGQERRLEMIRQAAGERAQGRILEDGCGVGSYLARLAPEAQQAVGLEIELERAAEARAKAPEVVCGVGEHLPFPADSFDLVLSPRSARTRAGRPPGGARDRARAAARRAAGAVLPQPRLSL